MLTLDRFVHEFEHRQDTSYENKSLLNSNYGRKID